MILPIHHSHSRSRILLQTLCCLLIHPLVIGLASAQESGYAKGLIVYLGLGDTPLTARAALFRSVKQAAPHSYYDVGGSSPLAVENGRILKNLDLSLMYADLTSDAERQIVERFSTEISDLSKQYPKSSEVCGSLVRVIDSFLERYDKGEVRLKGQWQNGQTYRDWVAAEQKATMERAAMLQKFEEQQQMEYANLIANYPPEVTQLTQTDYEAYRKKVQQFLETTDPETVGLGPLDPGLHERSKFIPRPQGTDQAGIYTGDSRHGPVVIWTSKGDQLVSMMVGLTFVLDLDGRQVGNERELTQVQHFLDRFQTGLVDLLPIFLATNKIERVMGKPTTVKTYSSPTVIMDVYVYNPETLGNGAMMQHVILHIF